ncbi:MAG TPA: class I lanthipeptide [Candidatus Dormibacteraeota bacterium]|nr:class I lanthipeptide [Candidatus Dormibacteraeota bacterium]
MSSIVERKLSLSRETVRELSEDQAAGAQGGANLPTNYCIIRTLPLTYCLSQLINPCSIVITGTTV